MFDLFLAVRPLDRQRSPALKGTSYDRFRVRECYRLLMLSHLRSELQRFVHASPLMSADVGRDCYLVGYSGPVLGAAAKDL